MPSSVPPLRVEQTILLPMGCGLESGQCVRWVLRDAVTGEVLAEQDAVSQVDLR